MCGCGASIPLLTTNTSPCGKVTVVLLEMYREQVQGVVGDSRYNDSELHQALDVLEAWMESKRQDPLCCRYQDYLPALQELVKRIMLQ